MEQKGFVGATVYSTQIKGMREDGKHKTRESQRWRKVQLQDRRSYGEVERPSSYLDDTDIWAGIDNLDHDFLEVKFEGESRGRAERGHDIVVASPEGEGAGCDEQHQDINVIDS